MEWRGEEVHSRGVRRDVVLSRWEIQVTRLSCRVLPLSSMSVEHHRVMERPFEVFVLGKVLAGRLRRPKFRAASEGRKQPQNPTRQESCLCLGNPDVGRSVMAGPTRKTVGPWAGLEKTCFVSF